MRKAPNACGWVAGSAPVSPPRIARVLTVVRLPAPSDASRLAELYRADREFLREWDPDRPDAFFTPDGQRAAIDAALHERERGRSWPGVIEYAGEPAGRINLNNILRGPLRSCFIGYWVAGPLSGRGIATSAVRQALEIAFHELVLHRVDAFTRIDNAGSRRVLEKNGFREVGVSERHIHIAGRWQDEVLFQRLAPWDDGVRLEP
jgi:ribosomal-protein-alanine N-acetyltransferase